MHPRPTNGVNTDYPTVAGAVANALDRRLKGNLIDNGAPQIWQRGTSFAAGASQVFTADRWAFFRSGFVTGATLSQQAGSNSQYCMRVQRDNGNASTAAIQLAQSLHSVNSIPTRGKPVTLAFRARMGALYSAASQALQVSLFSGTGTDQSVSAGLTSQSAVSSSTVALTTSWQDFTVPVGTPGASITQLAALFAFTPVGTAGATDYFEIEEIQLVIGDYAGNFPYETFAEELRRAQRCFWKTFPYATAPAQNSGTQVGCIGYIAVAGGGTSYYSVPVYFPVQMRATPTITFYNPSAANAKWRNTNLAADSSTSAAAALLAGGQGFVAQNQQVAGDLASHTIAVHATADCDF